MKILLASASPRRKELLQNLGYEFEVVSVHCDEVFPADMPVNKVAAYLSDLKADAFRVLENDEILITADTIVALENQILGKPKDAAEAKEMLLNLSGKTHQVYTGITIRTAQKTITKTEVADVEFVEISEDEVEYYIDKFRPFDKAGSYGVQEWIGMAKIRKMNGSFYTVMGLPTHLVYEILKDLE
jgi:septum formation protein